MQIKKLKANVRALTTKLARATLALKRAEDKLERDAARDRALAQNELNANEKAFVRFVARHSPLSVNARDIARVCYLGKGARSRLQAESWARNSARRPLREQLVVRVGRGAYRITRKGRKAVAK